MMSCFFLQDGELAYSSAAGHFTEQRDQVSESSLTAEDSILTS